MLNNTSGVQVRSIFPKFFERWPDHNAFLNALDSDVKALIKPLGFQNIRYKRLREMSSDWLQGKRPPEKLHGVGKYASDSYTLFVKGLLIDDAEDKELKKYVEWAHSLKVGNGFEQARDIVFHEPERCIARSA